MEIEILQLPETIRISQIGKAHLLKIRKLTGLDNWNTICRLCLMYSLANETRPEKKSRAEYSNIEISWKTFCGSYQASIETLARLRGVEDVQSEIERGLAQIARVNNLLELISALSPSSFNASR